MQMSEKKKIFQPKVIIGSILGFVSAAVGIVAVFFPSLLNLELERMPKYDGGEDWSETAELEDYHKFIKFLGDRIKDEKLFEVRFNLPLGRSWAPMTQEELFKKGIAFSEDNGFVCIIVTSSREDAAIGANTGEVKGFDVEFSDYLSSGQLALVGGSKFCFPDEMMDYHGQLNGYAHHDEYISSAVEINYYFKAVDKTAVKLKKY